MEQNDTTPSPVEGGLLAIANAELTPEKLCIYARARRDMTQQLRDELDYMVSNRDTYSVSVIFRALNATGYPMSRASVDHHLRGECVCER